MTVSCPSCAREYRLDPQQLSPGRRLRCRQCGAVFAPPAGGSAHAPSAAHPAPGSAPLVLLADEPREFRELVQRTLEDLGCRVETTDDGEAAFRFAVARRPPVLILNVYLKRMLGVAVCEGVKGSPDLRGTKVALIGTVFKSDRFIRAPGNLYGADDYFENVISEADLKVRLLRLLGRGDAAGRLAASGGIVPPLSVEALDPQEEIRRLARIMISDLKIYYPDGFRSALLQRNFAQTFREEMTQARDLIGRRFPAVPQAMQVLAAALKEGLGLEREAAVGAADR